tara:strand:+ start:846 stop:1238 length:393 start_codon:yes stop_codon:yes gene_type:complete
MIKWNEKSWGIFINLLIALAIVIFGVTSANAQSPCNDNLCVVQFNASWNATNSVEWLEELTDCKKLSISIDENKATQQQQSDYKIVVVPTIVIFNGGEEVKRFQADISFTMKATKEEVQEVVDEILMEDF